MYCLLYLGQINTHLQGLRVRMAIHMGSSEGGVKGPSCRFVHHLTDLSWGGMILLSEPVKDYEIRNRIIAAQRRHRLKVCTLNAIAKHDNFTVNQICVLFHRWQLVVFTLIMVAYHLPVVFTHFVTNFLALHYLPTGGAHAGRCFGAAGQHRLVGERSAVGAANGVHGDSHVRRLRAAHGAVSRVQ